MKVLQPLAVLTAGYLAAAALTESVSMDVTKTDWSSGWTYAAILFTIPLSLLALSALFGAIGLTVKAVSAQRRVRKLRRQL